MRRQLAFGSLPPRREDSAEVVFDFESYLLPSAPFGSPFLSSHLTPNSPSPRPLPFHSYPICVCLPLPFRPAMFMSSYVVSLSFPEDVILPMVLDERMPEDTLWLIFEEDFRFWPQGEDPDGSDDYEVRLKEVMRRRRRSRPRNKMPKGSVAGELPAQASSASSHEGAYRPSKNKGKGECKNGVGAPLHRSAELHQ